MKPSVCCVNPNCSFFNIISGDRRWIRRHGEYRRKCDSKVVDRFRCLRCRKTFSNQTFNPTYRQHRPRINNLVRKLICSKNSLRHIAKRHGINRKTVKRKFVFHAAQARQRQVARMKTISNINFLQMDEMETHEHTKCKPLSIAIAAVPGSRHILGAIASEMPANGLLAEISRKKYGFRRDDRQQAFQCLLRTIKPCLSSDVWIATDKKSVYPAWIGAVLPDAKHFKSKGRRGCVVGYGEMKKGGFDPLYWVNHAAATSRDNLARLLRRTWCNTKVKSFLQDALDILIDFHNEEMDLLDKPVLDRECWLAKCRLSECMI